jgi:hypothetical protein
MKPRVFIGSSVEGLGIAKSISKGLKSNVDAVLWESDPVFTAGETTVESLARVVPNFDLAIMVWTKDDTRKSRSVTSIVPRDNVILEYGYFSAALGRTRCLIVADKGITVPTDTAGITYIPIERSGRDNNVTKRNLETLIARIEQAIEREGLHPSRQFAAAFANSQLINTDPEVTRVLRLGVRGLSAITGITHSLGIHIWLLADLPAGIRMRRYGRQRLNDDPSPNDWGDFEIGKGIPGYIWRTGGTVMKDLTSGPYQGIDSASEWQKLSLEARFGSTWPMFTKARKMFSGLAGVPLTNGSAKVVGVLTANCGRSVIDPTPFVSDGARNWLEEIAAVAWDVLPRSVATDADLLSGSEGSSA